MYWMDQKQREVEWAVSLLLMPLYLTEGSTQPAPTKAPAGGGEYK